MRTATGLMLAATGAALAVTAADARTLVLRASGPAAARFPAGSLLDDPLNIVLAKGEALTLLDGSGTTNLKGPVKVAGRVATALTAADKGYLAALTRARTRRDRAAGVAFELDGVANRPAIAAASRPTRAAPRPAPGAAAPRPADTAPPKSYAVVVPPSPDLWDIDAAAGSGWCREADTGVALYRESAANPIDVQIVASTGKVLPLSWSAGANRLAIPPGWLTEGESTVRWRPAGGSEWREFPLTIRTIADTATPAALATALDGQECDVQLRRLASAFDAGTQ